MILRLVTLAGGSNYYSLLENRNELLKHEEIAPFVKDESVLIDNDTFERLHHELMLPVDEFKHLMFFKTEFDAKHYMSYQWEAWGTVSDEEKLYHVTKLKKEIANKY